MDFSLMSDAALTRYIELAARDAERYSEAGNIRAKARKQNELDAARHEATQRARRSQEGE